MYRRTLAAAVATAALMFAGAASAQQTSVGVTAGTTGLGLEFGYDVSDVFGLRANGNLFGYSKDVESDGIQYDGKLKLRSLGVLGDFYPFESGFRVTGGAYYNDNHVNLTATPSGPVTIGGTSYTLICPLPSGPSTILVWIMKEKRNGQEAQAGGDYRQAA